MEIKREDTGKGVLVFGIFLVILALSFELVYFAIFAVTVVFFYYLFKNRRNFEHEVILLFALVGYLFALVIFVLILGILDRAPKEVLGVAGGFLALSGLYMSGYLEKLKR